MTLQPDSPGWRVFVGTRKGQTSSFEVFGEDQGPLHQPSLLSPQFREKLQDVLPSLPSQDDYFLLKWLRGNPEMGDSPGGVGAPLGAGGGLSSLLSFSAQLRPAQGGGDAPQGEGAPRFWGDPAVLGHTWRGTLCPGPPAPAQVTGPWGSPGPKSHPGPLCPTPAAHRVPQVHGRRQHHRLGAT